MEFLIEINTNMSEMEIQNEILSLKTLVDRFENNARFKEFFENNKYELMKIGNDIIKFLIESGAGYYEILDYRHRYFITQYPHLPYKAIRKSRCIGHLRGVGYFYKIK